MSRSKFGVDTRGNTMLEVVAGAAVTVALASAGFVIALGSRVAVVESRITAFEKWLERVEGKLDTALQQDNRK